MREVTPGPSPLQRFNGFGQQVAEPDQDAWRLQALPQSAVDGHLSVRHRSRGGPSPLERFNSSPAPVTAQVEQGVVEVLVAQEMDEPERGQAAPPAEPGSDHANGSRSAKDKREALRARRLAGAVRRGHIARGPAG